MGNALQQAATLEAIARRIRRDEIKRLREGDRLTFTEIGRRLGVSRQRAAQLYHEAKDEGGSTGGAQPDT